MHDKKQSLKMCLIEAGFWSAEEGDPAADEKAIEVVLGRIDARLAKNTYLYFYGETPESSTRKMHIIHEGGQITLATGNDLFDLICNAALALPAFLKRHPEYAAKSAASLGTD